MKKKSGSSEILVIFFEDTHLVLKPNSASKQPPSNVRLLVFCKGTTCSNSHHKNG